MKKAIALAFSLPLILFTGACERHSWEETKSLYHHGHHAEDGDHGKGDHSKDHGKKEKH